MRVSSTRSRTTCRRTAHVQSPSLVCERSTRVLRQMKPCGSGTFAHFALHSLSENIPWECRARCPGCRSQGPAENSTVNLLFMEAAPLRVLRTSLYGDWDLEARGHSGGNADHLVLIESLTCLDASLI
jgi:hypothetical protein